MTVQDAAVEWVHWKGAFGLSELREALRSDGYRPRRSSLDELHLDYYDLERCGDLLVSTDIESPLLGAFAAMRRLGIDQRQDLVGGIRRTLGSGRDVESIGRSAAAEAIADRFCALAISDADTSLFDDDERVVEILRSKPGGVCNTKDLGALVKTDPFISSMFNLSYSPLLEMVSSGVYGVRGAPIDLAAVRHQRPTTRSPWARWGRLDRRRLWVQVASRGPALRARIPNDCLDVLTDRRQPLVSLTGSPLGSLVIDHHDIHVDWAHPAPPDWESSDHQAVIEFDLVDSYARLLAGASTTEDPDPRFIDGCVLHDGRWNTSVDIDESLLSTRCFVVPKAIDGLADLNEGETRSLQSECGDVTAICEPHAYRIQLPEEPELPVDGHLRLDIRGGDCWIEVMEPTGHAVKSLLRTVGIAGTVKNSWQAIGAALGLESATHVDIARRFADRDRFDLADLARTAPLTSARTDEVAGTSSDQFELEEGQLVLNRESRRTFARRVRGTGPLNLQWTTRPDPDPDFTWATIVHVILRAWAAGAAEPVYLRRTERGWELPDDPQPTILDALRRIGERDGPLPRTDAKEPNVPVSAFGATHAIACGDRLAELVIDGPTWRAVNYDGIVTESAPLGALLGSGDR